MTVLSPLHTNDPYTYPWNAAVQSSRSALDKTPPPAPGLIETPSLDRLSREVTLQWHRYKASECVTPELRREAKIAHNRLIYAAQKQGQIRQAEKAFDDAFELGVAETDTYNLLIQAFINHNLLRKAIDVISSPDTSHLNNEVGFSMVISCAGKRRDFSRANLVYNWTLPYRFPINSQVHISFLRAAYKCEEILTAVNMVNLEACMYLLNVVTDPAHFEIAQKIYLRAVRTESFRSPHLYASFIQAVIRCKAPLDEATAAVQSARKHHMADPFVEAAYESANKAARNTEIDATGS